MSIFLIREPNMRNVKLVVHTYNAVKGRGIEIFYNLLSGRLIIVDYYKNCNINRFRKIPCISDDVHLEKITTEYVLQEIEKIKQYELDYRKNEKKHKKRS